jgi:hypothetical protein
MFTARYGLDLYHMKFSGHYTYHQFNIQQFSVLPAQYIYVFCVDLRTNSDYFPISHFYEFHSFSVTSYHKSLETK